MLIVDCGFSRIGNSLGNSSFFGLPELQLKRRVDSSIYVMGRVPCGAMTSIYHTLRPQVLYPAAAAATRPAHMLLKNPG